MHIQHLMRLLSLLIALQVLVTVGCKDKDASAEGTEEAKKSLIGKSEEIEIPAGSADELFRYVVSLGKKSLPEDAEERGKALRIRMAKQVKACDSILGKEIPPDSRLSAVRMKLDGLRTLAVVDPDGFGKDFEPYVDDLSKGSDQLLARLARATKFQSHVNDYVSLKGQESEPILKELDTLLSDKDAGPTTFSEARSAVEWMFPTQDDNLKPDEWKARIKVAAECYRKIGNRFYDYGDETISNEAKLLLAGADDLTLSTLSQSLRSDEEGALDLINDYLKEIVKSKRPHGSEVGFVIQTAQMLEYDGLLQPALDVYKMAWQNFRETANDEGKKNLEDTYRRARRRLNLVGQETEIDGVLLEDGREFQWADYRGNFTLVCFWASWDQNWKHEIENIRKGLNDYKSTGLKIVTINLDDRKTVKEYVANTNIDWPVVVSEEVDRAGVESNINAVRFGVDAVPFMILVDPDGRVVEAHVYGPRLHKALAKRLAAN